MLLRGRSNGRAQRHTHAYHFNISQFSGSLTKKEHHKKHDGLNSDEISVVETDSIRASVISENRRIRLAH